MNIRLISAHSVFNKKNNMGLFLLLCLSFLGGIAESAEKNADITHNESINDTELINLFIKSKGYPSTIVFDSKNIKQYWVDKSVASIDNSIHIISDFKNSGVAESIPLKIQLMNVTEDMDCIVNVISDQSNISFSILNHDLTPIGLSYTQEDFIQTHIYSSVFHLEDTRNLSFNIVFSSMETTYINIKQIVLSFVKNNNSIDFKQTNKSAIKMIGGKYVDEIPSDDSIVIEGKSSQLLYQNKIYTGNRSFKTTALIKNIGDTPATIYVGYALYTKDLEFLDHRNYPFNNINNVLEVVSVNEDNNSIIVNTLPKWSKNCFLALNAKEDLSDIPNTTLVEAKVENVTELEDGTAKIIMNGPLKQKVFNGLKVRIHGKSGGYFYVDSKEILPGEDYILENTIQKDDFSHEWRKDFLPNGVEYISPVLLSFSSDGNNNKIKIIKFNVSY